MKKALILSFAAFAAVGCGNAAQSTNQTANANTAAVKSNDSTIVSSRSSGAGDATTTAPSSNKPSSSSTESPMARPIDVSALSADIERAEKDFEKTAKDAKTKTDFAEKYFARASALTEAAQYRAALGDYRKGLKLNPADEDARKMHDQILSIFKSIGREPPREGEEPAALPFKKDS